MPEPSAYVIVRRCLCAWVGNSCTCALSCKPCPCETNRFERMKQVGPGCTDADSTTYLMKCT